MPLSWTREGHMDPRIAVVEIGMGKRRCVFKLKLSAACANWSSNSISNRASKQDKHEYAGLPSGAQRLLVKAFLRERTGGSNQGAKMLLGLL
jgi:hypothetical protein